MSPNSQERFELLDRVWCPQRKDRENVLWDAKQFVELIPEELEGFLITGEEDCIVVGWNNANTQRAAVVGFQGDIDNMLQVVERNNELGFQAVAAAYVSPTSLSPAAIALIKFVLGENNENS